LDEIKRLNDAAGYRPQQPTQVVSGSAQHGIDYIAHRPFEPTPTHSVIGLQVTDRRFDRLSTF